MHICPNVEYMNESGSILIITYYLPPKDHIASQRTGGLCEYLSKSGWDIVALTADHSPTFESSYEIISTDFRSTFLSRLINKYKGETRSDFSNQKKSTSVDSSVETTGYLDLIERILGPPVRFIRDEIVHYPDDKRLWENNAVKTGNNYITNHEVSCIISSSGPFTSHRIASRLSKHHDLPWIADYRDRWSQNPYKNHTSIREFFEKRMEINTIKPANEIVTVSDPIAEDISNIHNKKVTTILNGHDKSRVPDRDLSDEYTILYPGQFYRGKHNPKMLFSAVSQLLDDGIDLSNFRIDFYGYAQPWIKQLANRYQIEEFINDRDFAPQTEILKRERESHCLLSLHWDDPRSEGVYTGKIFEYLAAERPIVAINPPKVVEQLLKETEAGESFYDDEELADWIRTQYTTFQEKGKVNYNKDPESVQKYSQQRMAKKFENLIVKNISEY